MNTLGYVARQFDGLAKTPPSTPTAADLPRISSWSTKSLLFNSVRAKPQRSKSSPAFASSSSMTTTTSKSQTRAPKTPPKIVLESPPLTAVTLVPPRSKKHIETVIDQIFFLRVFLLVWDHLKSAWSSLVEGVAAVEWKVDVKGKGKALEQHIILDSTTQLPPSPSPRTPTPTFDNLSPPPTASSRSSTPTLSTRTSPFRQRKTLVLDLDETLIHSTSRPILAQGGSNVLGLNLWGNGNKAAGHMVEVVMGGRSTLYHVYKRPFVDYFLRTVSNWYTLVIFTASMKEYADPVIDWLDAGRDILSHRFFRDSCTQLPNGSYTKDLTVIDADLSRVCLVDNSPVSYSVNEANGIPIEGWTHDPCDEALLDLLPVLDSLRFTSDVRRVLGLRKAGTFMIYEADSS